MAITIFELAPGALEVIIAGTIGASDYNVFIPAVEKLLTPPHPFSGLAEMMVSTG